MLAEEILAVADGLQHSMDCETVVTWKAKTDTNALPFNARNRLLSV